MKRKIEYFLKHNSWVMKTFIAVGSAFFNILGKFVKVDDHIILFTSFSGKQYNDSPKVIYEYLLQHGLSRHYRCIWAFEQPNNFQEIGCERVKIDTWQYFIYTLKAKYWVTSVNIERGLKYKKKNQVYLNTWHGPAINLMGNAVAGRSDFNWDHIDFFCISGKYEEEIIQRDFNVKAESLLLSGLPRNDDLYKVDNDIKASVKKKLKIPPQKKIILYAPTWRESTDNGKHCNIRPPININKWKKCLSEDYILLIRAHVNTREMLGIEYDDFVINVSNYPNVNDLLIISDYLVSDYSSIIMDYSILCKPIICFGYDYKEYSKDRGGFYFDLDKEIPSGICYTEDEVINYIINMNYQKECFKVRAFKDRHIEVGGNATEICVKKLLGI